MGLERLVLLVESLDESLYASNAVDIYLMPIGEQAESEATKIAEQVRNELPTVKVQQHCGGGNFKKQMKKAMASDAAIAMIIGDDELANASVSIKFLKQDKPQASVFLSELSAIAEWL
jgi:histidyl-tRNA synthetase